MNRISQHMEEIIKLHEMIEIDNESIGSNKCRLTIRGKIIDIEIMPERGIYLGTDESAAWNIGIKKIPNPICKEATYTFLLFNDEIVNKLKIDSSNVYMLPPNKFLVKLKQVLNDIYFEGMDRIYNPTKEQIQALNNKIIKALEEPLGINPEDENDVYVGKFLLPLNIFILINTVFLTINLLKNPHNFITNDFVLISIILTGIVTIVFSIIDEAFHYLILPVFYFMVGVVVAFIISPSIQQYILSFLATVISI